MKRVITWVVLAAFMLGVGLAAAGCGQGTQSSSGGQPQQAAEPTQPIEIKWADGQPAGDKFWRGMIDGYIQALEEAAGGKVKFTKYPAETLVKMAEMYDGIVSGVADMGLMLMGFNPGRFPVMETLELPGIPRDPMEAGRVPWEFYQKFTPEELKGVKVLLASDGATSGLMSTKKPIKTLEDLKGMQIAATGAGIDIMKALGATPVPLPMTDRKPALSKGIIEGNFGPVGPLQTWGLAEYLKYVTFVPSLQSTTFLIIMNLDKWNSLPPDVQQAFEQASLKQLEEAWYYGPSQSSFDALEWAQKEQGVTVINLTREEEERWNALFKDVQQAHVKTLNEKGLPGEEILQAVIDLNKKYLD